MGASKGAFTGWPLFFEMALALIHMMSMVVAIPGMWSHIKPMGASYPWIGWCFAAYPMGSWLVSRYLRDFPLAPIVEINKKTNTTVRDKPRGNSIPRYVYMLLLLIAVGGNVLYAFATHPGMVLAGRFLSGMGGGSMVLGHKFVEFSTGADDMMLRSRMVMFGALQAVGTVLGVVIAGALSPVPSFSLFGVELQSTAMPPLFIALLYILVIPGSYMTYKPISKDTYEHVDTAKGEMDSPPNNYMPSQRLGVLVPAIVYDRGQARPSSLPDVFSTAVVLVLYFMLTNLLVGIEVAHGPFCTDVFEWGALDISITYGALIISGLVGIAVSLSVSDEVPCNRRLFGALVMIFVTYGVMLQPSTPKEQYIGFLVLMGCCFFICDLALVEIYIDKIGEEDNARLTAACKLQFMGWINQTATVTRVLAAIVTGYIYSYFSEKNHLSRRPYAVYGCGFGVSVLLVMMCMIFYKRFQMRSTENQMLPQDKLPLQPQQINCMDEA